MARGAGGVSADVKARRGRVDSGAGPVPHAALEAVGVVVGRVRPPAAPARRREGKLRHGEARGLADGSWARRLRVPVPLPQAAPAPTVALSRWLTFAGD